MLSPVLLTGATGYLGSTILKLLLEQGYSVHMTTRSIPKTNAEHWFQQLNEKHPGAIQLFEADLQQPKAFHEALAGVQAVIHSASPFKVQGIKSAQHDLLDPAVKGTENLLTALNDFPEIKKVVLTSSIAAIYGDAADIELHASDQFNESHWNTSSSLTHQPYSYSKVSAEKAAWKINEGKAWKLITINPGFILGPSITPRTDSTSIRFMLDMLNGKFQVGVPKISFCVVDVRDVALAHVLALASERASGRHICTNKTLRTIEIADLIKKHTPVNSKKIPTRALPNWLTYIFAPILAGFSWTYLKRNLNYVLAFDNRKIQASLNMTFRPIETTISDHIEQLIQDDLVKK
jgi:nucleoside-diphosphate-sugar epimerase